MQFVSWPQELTYLGTRLEQTNNSSDGAQVGAIQEAALGLQGGYKGVLALDE